MKMSIALLAGILFLSPAAHATCTNNVVDAGALTTVTITATEDENCFWSDANASASNLLSVAAVTVPALGKAQMGTAEAISFGRIGNSLEYSAANCVTEGLVLVCSDLVLDTEGASGHLPNYRNCLASNKDATLVTATCVFTTAL